MAFLIENNVLVKYTEEPGVTAVTVPEGITEIGFRAFDRCAGLTKITLPESITAIGGYAFSCCTGLQSIDLPAGMTAIDNGAFEQCTALTGLRFPANLRKIGLSCFKGCSGLTEITVPEKVVRLEGWVFQNCTGLRKVTLPETLQYAGNTVFSGCSSLESIRIPQGVTSLGSSIFANCTALREITLPENLQCESNGINVLYNCPNLQVIRLRDDDPALKRDYGSVPKLEKCIEKAFAMIRTGDFDLRIDLRVKYPFITLHYLHTGDENALAYIRKNAGKFIQAGIEAGDLAFIRFAAQKELFSKRSIGKFIRQAQDEQQPEIEAFLTDCQNREIMKI